MKNHILIFCLISFTISLYSQDKPKTVYIVSESVGLNSFTNWRKDYQHEGWVLEVQLERIKDSSRQSTLFRFSSAYFKSKDLNLSENKFLTSLHTIGRLYISKQYLFKTYLQIGVLETFTTSNIEIGAIVGGGLHIGKFRKNNLTLEINHIWHTGGFNYLNIQIGFSSDIDNLFR
jgi:hypothetical protein